MRFQFLLFLNIVKLKHGILDTILRPSNNVISIAHKVFHKTGATCFIGSFVYVVPNYICFWSHMLVLNKSARCARRDKHTPCIKTNRLKRQNRSRAERAVRAKPLGESGPFFSHIGNAIFCPFFIGGFFSFLYQVAKFAFVFSASKSPLGFTLICVFPFKFPLNIHFFNINFP